MKYVYGKSKVLAEKAAWDFIKSNKKNNSKCFDLSVIIPVTTFGPLLTPSISSTPKIFLDVLKMQNGSKMSDRYYPFCDVRDVALAHYEAAFSQEVIGHRHLIVSTRHLIPISTWAKIFRNLYEKQIFKLNVQFDAVPKRTTEYDDSRMRNVLGIKARDVETTVKDMVDSFIEFGLLSKI